MIFTPDGSLQPERMESKFVTQFDVPPTILSLAGYPDEYVALGKNILGSDDEKSYALMYIKGAYQVCGPKYAIRFSPDMKKIDGVFDWKTDYDMPRPLTKYDEAEVKAMTDWARAFMQDYTVRLNRNQLSAKK